MSTTNHEYDASHWLIDYADHLNAICTPGFRPKVFYELMSGALVWSDETNEETPIEVIWALRFLWACRTALMLNKARDGYRGAKRRNLRSRNVVRTTVTRGGARVGPQR